jgi:putative two-component system response regulator
MEKQGYIEKIPVLVISGENSVSIEKRCFELGISDFIRKPFDNTLVRKRVQNVAELYSYKKNLEEKIRQQTGTLRTQYSLLQKQAKELEKKNENIIDILGTVVECRDMESGEHIQRVKGYTQILANEMMQDYPEYGLNAKKIAVIVSASALHDIGKIAIPDHILLKPGRLTADEYEYMKSHTTRGCEILNHIKGAWDEEYGKCSYEICRHHHERYDGKGYPDGLSGDEIPISAQLVSIADVYDALVNERVYKDAVPKEQAFQMIVQGECGVFSPKLLEAFRKARKGFEELTDMYAKKAAENE